MILAIIPWRRWQQRRWQGLLAGRLRSLLLRPRHQAHASARLGTPRRPAEPSECRLLARHQRRATTPGSALAAAPARLTSTKASTSTTCFTPSTTALSAITAGIVVGRVRCWRVCCSRVSEYTVGRCCCWGWRRDQGGCASAETRRDAVPQPFLSRRHAVVVSAVSACVAVNATPRLPLTQVGHRRRRRWCRFWPVSVTRVSGQRRRL